MKQAVQYKRDQLRSIILTDLDSGKIGIGDQLPTESEMVRQYGMSRATVREGIALLVQDGVLQRRQGSGTFVRSLKPQRNSKLLAALVPYKPGRWDNISIVIHEIEQRAHDRGYSLVLSNHDNNPEKLRESIDRVIEQDVAGVIFSPLLVPGAQQHDLETVRLLEDHDIPFVLIGSPISVETATRYSYVSSNGFTAVREMVRHLVRVGHRRIAYIRGFSDIFSVEERYGGYVEEMRRQKLELPEEYVQQIQVEPLERQGRVEIRRILACENPPTAVMCVHDGIAKNVMEEVASMGKRVPDDLAVVGFDDAYFADQLNPPLTTIRTPLAEEAVMDAQILFDKIDGTLRGERQEFLSAQLVIRQSCGAPAALRGEMPVSMALSERAGNY